MMRRFISGLVAVTSIFTASTIVTLATSADETKQQAKPPWLATAEKSLLGTWKNTNPKTESIPQIDILFEKDVLKIRFWGRTSPKDSPFGPPDRLLVLSKRTDVKTSKKDKAIAFATHKADFAVYYFTLKLRDNVIHLEGVSIFTDSSRRSNRIYIATFKKP